jgi:hypothetical protein
VSSNGLLDGLRVLEPAARDAYSRVTEFLARIAQGDLVDLDALIVVEERWAEVLHDVINGESADVEEKANLVYGELVALLRGSQSKRRVA